MFDDHGHVKCKNCRNTVIGPLLECVCCGTDETEAKLFCMDCDDQTEQVQAQAEADGQRTGRQNQEAGGQGQERRTGTECACLRDNHVCRVRLTDNQLLSDEKLQAWR